MVDAVVAMSLASSSRKESTVGVVAISVAALLWVWAIGDVLAIEAEHLHSGEKAAWVATVMLLSVAGAMAWLLVGRHATRTRPTTDRPPEIDGWPSVSCARLRGRGHQCLRNG
ncbi:PLD nuclease N-terminal domain-containing protein [Mycobacterium sp. BMJ-28]